MADWYAMAARDCIRDCARRVVAAQDALYETERRLRDGGHDDLADEFAAAIELVEGMAGAAQRLRCDANQLLREYDRMAARVAAEEVA